MEVQQCDQIQIFGPTWFLPKNDMKRHASNPQIFKNDMVSDMPKLPNFLGGMGVKRPFLLTNIFFPIQIFTFCNLWFEDIDT